MSTLDLIFNHPDGSVFLTGDTHGEEGRFFKAAFEGEEKLTSKDYALVAGDWGYVFKTKGTMDYFEERRILNALAEKPYTILFVDGNHENFDRLDRDYGVEEWHGGKVHRIRPNILHLMRGQVFNICGMTFFTMGGGYSIDKATRRDGYSWWSAEMPSNEEYREATRNLERVCHKVDYIVTHTCPTRAIYEMHRMGDADPHEAELNGFLDWVYDTTEFRHWFFGHWHTDMAGLTRKFSAVYFDVHCLNSANLI